MSNTQRKNTHELIGVTTFEDVAAGVGKFRNYAPICSGWFVEFSPDCIFTVSPSFELVGVSRGLKLQFSSSAGWLRLWRPLEFANIERARGGTFSLRGRTLDGNVSMNWAALLKTGAQQKRIFALKLVEKERALSRDWEDVKSTVSLSGLPTDIYYIFAVQFSGGPGTIELDMVRLQVEVNLKPIESQFPAASEDLTSSIPELTKGDGTTTTTKVPLAPQDDLDGDSVNSAEVFPDRLVGSVVSQKAIEAVVAAPLTAEQMRASIEGRLAGSVIEVKDGQLLGWARVKAGDSVLVIIDGRVITVVEPKGVAAAQATTIPELASWGFEVAIPPQFVDDREHTISLRIESTGRRIGRGTQKFFLNKPSRRRVLSPKRESPVQPLEFAANERTPMLRARPIVGRAKPPENARRVAVVSWDMGHNPVGRAFLLADMAGITNHVELVGPMFPMYGKEIWPPIAKSSIVMHAFPAPTMKEFLIGALELAAKVKCDVVHIGKARFSSLLIGALIKIANNCPMVVDVDDHELSFFPNRVPASLDELEDAIRSDPKILDTPYTEIWTRLAETLVSECDGITVSNYSLQNKFGGVVVRHGRDELLFDPVYYDRRSIRAEFGYTDDDRVVLFLGTPRPHKGVFEIADALEQLNDDRLALCVIGSINDKRVSSRFATYKHARISLNSDQPWERLPELVTMADAVFLIQDPTSAISEYQIPAKLTDALSLGVPVYATPVPPLLDIIATGAIKAINDLEDIKVALRDLAQGQDQTNNSVTRDFYLTELSYEVNSARMKLAFDKAQREFKLELPMFDKLMEILESHTELSLPRFKGKLKAPAINSGAKPDIVFLWKQNDSDIYGRRPDMMVRYLLKSGAVGRILHFDAPISLADLEKQVKHGSDAVAHQGNLIYVNTIRRVLRQFDTPTLIRRTFLHRNGKQAERFLGVDLPPKEAYGEFIEGVLKDASISSSSILWVCPVVFDYDLFKSLLGPEFVVADIIDDQRRFQGREQYREKVARAYEDVLGDADQIFANCDPVKEGFASLRPDIRVIPNGAEIFDLSAKWEVPEELRRLPRPIFGYVGNLRDRVDLELIGKVADRFPRGSVVLIGSAHDRPEVLSLTQKSNIHILGVKPYDEASRYIRSFDVAMVPHLRNELSESMNPLKMYVYFALGKPIVTTDLANIGDIGPFAGVASSHEEFLDMLERAATGASATVSQFERESVLQKVSWETRVREVLRAFPRS